MKVNISKQAELELLEIALYTLVEYGVEQQIKYENDFNQLFDRLRNQPFLGINATDIKPDLYKIVCNSHIVFYRVNENEILIARILHGSRDIPKQFTE